MCGLIFPRHSRLLKLRKSDEIPWNPSWGGGYGNCSLAIMNPGVTQVFANQFREDRVATQLESIGYSTVLTIAFGDLVVPNPVVQLQIHEAVHQFQFLHIYHCPQMTTPNHVPTIICLGQRRTTSSVSMHKTCTNRPNLF